MAAIWRRLLGFALGSASFFNANCTIAQITPDRTLPNNSNVTINGSVFNITGGTQAGRNLFHSFQQFSVPANNTALFNNGSDIQNIFSRVTGGSVSDIQGTIRALGTANLFFLNPNGIVFGRNASLNVGGSFVATTANAIQFGNLGSFSASEPNNPALLTVNPTALFYNQIAADASIQNNSQATVNGFVTGLQVPDGKSLLLVGGNVTLDGGALTAYGGRVELASLAAPGTIGLNVAGDTLSLSAPSNVQRGNISLTNQAFVDVSGAGGGDITVNAGNLAMSNSYLFAGIGTGLGNGSSTKAGDININVDSISLSDGAQIGDVTFGQGNAGNITIIAKGVATFDGVDSNGFSSGLFSNVQAGAVGNAGNINITAGVLSLTKGAEFGVGVLSKTDTLPAGQGNSGTINVNVGNALIIAGINTGIFGDIGTGGVGRGGDIKVQAGNISLIDNGLIRSSTFGQGNAGNILLTARDGIFLDKNAFIASNIQSSAIGNAANIDINTGSLSVKDGSQIYSFTRGVGNAGNITITAKNAVTFDGVSNNGFFSGLFSSVEASAVGNGGKIDINAGSLSLTNRGQISSATFGRGDAGYIRINVRDAITLDGNSTGIFSNLFSTALGKGGDIQLTSGSLSVSNGAQLLSSTAGQGSGGNITINTGNAISIFGNAVNNTNISGVFSNLENTAVGNGGNINITAGTLYEANNAQLSASALGLGNAGNINITTKEAISLDAGSTVSSTLGVSTARRVSLRFDENNRPILTLEPFEGNIFQNAKGNSGNINIRTNRLTVTNGARLTTSTSGQGNAGNIDINTSTAIFSGSSPNGFPSSASSAVETSGVGNGGIIKITTDELTVDNGAQLIASTFGTGDAGSIDITARDTVSFDGVGRNGPSGASSAVETGTQGNGGNLTVDAKRLNIVNGAAGDVSNLGSGNRNAGNLQVRADFINLDFGKLIANSTSGQGGNINLQTSDIVLLRHNSLISNTSGTAQLSGNGGNFTLNTKFLVAPVLNNSDIVTNAFNGRGGKIDITASDGVFGFVVRSQEDLERSLSTTDVNQLDPQKLKTNDISSISQTGTTIISPDIDPTRGLIILPTVNENPPKLVSSSCTAFNEVAGGNNFTITGRGGLPPSPYEPLTSDAIWSDTRLPLTTAHQNQPNKHAAKIKPKPIEIVPATGWVFNDKGEVTLISSVSNATSSTPTSCPAR
ncbi:filamentous hemagglutinin N-terminal domain-containing protein [Aetokthonos hydrillicola Thurmond2011]|jgi:filamentous hemagglutinin family protein|uniref:Filamentous hemagglutinin N-terminal domain-containing protein n=1 Tax=Aetokthonos hydrillicola Thurmond2011 TaxID=2712845 RepID=A0AAP5M9I6_9CYAN|nr:filamentous hemagglutinin N-terminal domain-containing protein [Aetokthonos hydrillicola]MBO3461210.1 filamentous hemagglutinin N-terminal domain-containing protein [Aetokthonos hydrillicola CCALA 1050]MBW4589736.1 filamentous hemagglutinin N-terminal domain-containing protein [Aetokthonos hydrillicola CCALA 1050]MDR9900231.1 filamentous hemagglutinin N-terminal domain-containing protein [Aetokthonos hydrillicola Thurmond2011]